MTPEQQKEMQDFRATLPIDLQEALDEMIGREGEEAIYKRLGHLRSQAEYIASL